VRYQRLLIGLLGLALWSVAQAQTPAATTAVPRVTAVGDLLVAPTRVILDDRTRTAEITLINVGAAKATYRVSFLHQRMSEVGEMKIIEAGQEAADERFADELVRFTPRQVVLEPRLAQTLRVQLRLPEGLADGEYRSHLLFRAVPDAVAPAAPGADQANELAIELRPVYGVSIPLIVRHGATSATVTLSDLALQAPAAADQPSVLTVRLNRSGTASCYGNLVVNLLPVGGGKAVTVGTIGGVAVYTPNATRVVQMPLTAIPAGVTLQGTLQIVYQEKQEQGGAVLAEGTLQVP